MRNVLPILIGAMLCLFSLPAAAGSTSSDEEFYLVPVRSRSEVDLLRFADVPVRDRTREGVIVRIGDDQVRTLMQLGFDPVLLPGNPAHPSPESRKADHFHTNSEIVAQLDNLASGYPSIVRRFTLGETVEGRSIPGVKISANPDTDENEPEFRVVGAHHGDEIMSIEISLNFATYLASQYGSDETVTRLVDGAEFYIIPCLNMDGHQADTRENYNGVDLNRDYGFQYHSGSWAGDGSESGAYSQPEVRAFADHHFARSFVISFSFHTTADYVNFVWNYTDDASPEESLVSEISDIYADASGYTSINGYDWYQTYGDTNDFSFGTKGDIDWTIETENSNIAATWAKNRPALIGCFERALWGISGRVTDADSGAPLSALVWAKGRAWPIYTDPSIGDYHRILKPGTADLWVWAPGYEPVTVEDLALADGASLTQDVELTRIDAGYYAFMIRSVTTDNEWSRRATEVLGPPDNVAYTLSETDSQNPGSIVLDMGRLMQGKDGQRIKVYEGSPAGNERYRVYLSGDYLGPWTLIGDGQRTKTFDLALLGNQSARYVLIQDRGDGSGSYAGFDLDAVEYLPDPDPVDGDEEVDPDSDPDPDPDPDPDLADGDADPDEALDGDTAEEERIEEDAPTEGTEGEAEPEIDGEAESAELESETEADPEGEAEGPVCTLPLECFELTLTQPGQCARTVIRGVLSPSRVAECVFDMKVCPLCSDTVTTLSIEGNGIDLEGPSGCRFDFARAGEWDLQGTCGLGQGITGLLKEFDCDGLGVGSCESECVGCPEDGDEEDGMEVDLPMPDGDETPNVDGDDSDGDSTPPVTKTGKKGGCGSTGGGSFPALGLLLFGLALWRRRTGPVVRRAN